MRTGFRTNGSVKPGEDGGTQIELQGDCWRAAKHFLIHQGLVHRQDVHCHGALGDGLAGLRDFAQLEAFLEGDALPAPAALRDGPAPRARAGRAPRPPPSTPPPPPPPPPRGAGGGPPEVWADVEKRLQQLDKERNKRVRVEELQHLLELVQAEVEVGAGAVLRPSEVLTILRALLREELPLPGRGHAVQPEGWARGLRAVRRLLGVLAAHPEAGLRAGDPLATPSEGDALCTPQHQAQDLLLSSVLRLDQALHEALLATSYHDAAYGRHLDGTVHLLGLLADSLSFFRSLGAAALPEAEWRIAARLLDAVYHLDDANMRSALRPTGVDPSAWDSAASVCQLCDTVCRRGGDSRARTRAILQQVYHHALHRRLKEAEALFVLSGAAAEAARQDLPTQVLCNRTVAQLGLGLFCVGQLEKARECLEGLCCEGRAVQLLGQKLLGGYRDTFEDEKVAAPRFLVPQHLHLPVPRIEAAHLVCAVLLDGPRLAALEARRPRVTFGAAAPYVLGGCFLERELEKLDRLPYDGPPEDSRDWFLAAARHLKIADWETCADCLDRGLAASGWGTAVLGSTLLCWLRGKVKAACLEAYLATAAPVYSCFELQRVAEMFQLGEQVARSTVNRLMFAGTLAGSWDEASQFVLLDDSGPGPGADAVLGLAMAGCLGGFSAGAGVGALSGGLLPPQRRGGPAAAAQPARAPDAGRPAAAGSPPGAAKSRVGRNSRFRKDLINLNKAVAKWLQRGELSRDEIIARVKASPPAAHLLREQGAAFREEDFVQGVLSRAATGGAAEAGAEE